MVGGGVSKCGLFIVTDNCERIIESHELVVAEVVALTLKPPCIGIHLLVY